MNRDSVMGIDEKCLHAQLVAMELLTTCCKQAFGAFVSLGRRRNLADSRSGIAKGDT